MAVTRREMEMLSLADAGLDPAAIADRMGIKSDSVKRTLTMLTGDDRREREGALRYGSDRLLAAIERERARGAIGGAP